ncbi:nucleoside triphosphate pyrophosphohydrolase [Thalassomonas viridans]|uniref:Nucleoside triphosphate pyrophosphohydrolase n=1 Tax=Thalassomonas viridans TaxID=137584 RepID=A0AAE9Z5E7_9GAMM|nr:nucleoside triphosphate pyrophosphohydrolase [Thalassomonas viridans]WDE06379.1 nucleoside triphosphate pyrophosphohydrolase [Thalassomonas viridans]
MLDKKPSMEKLRWIMEQLRDPVTGCPWDLKQDFASIVPHTLEEAYEVADAIEQGDFGELEKELGDLLFQVVFYSQLGKEEKLFDFDSVVAAICEKLIRRHPHVFAKSEFSSEAEIKANWENEKIKERQAKNDQQSLSILADIPKSLPALSQAAKIQKRCAHVGFDWHEIKDVFAKVAEEVDEVQEHLHDDPEELTAELGDLMFAVVNLCRHAKQDPEAVLRQANQKFSKRFQGVEAKVAASGQGFEQHSLEQLENYWQEIKADEQP